MAQGHLTISNIFSALYADLDSEREPMSGGRSMGGHFVTASRKEKILENNLANVFGYVCIDTKPHAMLGIEAEMTCVHQRGKTIC